MSIGNMPPPPPALPTDPWLEAIKNDLPDLAKPLVDLAPEHWRWPLLAGLGSLALLALLVWLAWKAWKHRNTWLAWPWVLKLEKRFFAKPLPQARRFSVAIARIEGDKDDALRTLMVESLRDLPGLDPLRFDRSSTLAQADNPRAQEEHDHAQARAWLKESGADVLIWGQVLATQPERQLRLYFSARSSNESQTTRLSETQAISLPSAAREPLQAIIRVQILSRLGSYSRSHAVARKLQSEITRLQTLVHTWPSGPVRGALQGTLGNAWQTVGAQLGDDAALEQAVAAFGEALEVFEAAQASYYVEIARRNRERALALLKRPLLGRQK